jgi:transcriptional regulator with XRE-family HTH domain
MDDRRAALRDFLRSRRARLQPVDVGLPDRRSDRRRVPGLRREEVARLAGWHPEAYARFEQGRLEKVGEPMLDALARALRLGDDDRRRLYALAGRDGARPPEPKPPRPQRVRRGVVHLLTSLGVPALVVGRRTEVLAHNAEAALLLGLVGRGEPNLTRLVFGPEGAELFADWESAAVAVLGALRLDVARHPDDPLLRALIGELVVMDGRFRRLWAAPDPPPAAASGEQTLLHPDLGELELRWEALRLAGDADQTLVAFSAQPDSPAADALQVLRDLAAGPRSTWVRT